MLSTSSVFPAKYRHPKLDLGSPWNITLSVHWRKSVWCSAIWEQGDLSDPERFDLNCKGIYNVLKDVLQSAIAKIEAFSNENGYTYLVGETSQMYYPNMQLTRNAR